jgi:tetratricopeptide (TPR) repeat protein
LVAGGGLYGGARLWDLGADKPSSAVLVAAGAKIIRLPTDPFLITRDGKWLAASIGDGALRVWELNGQLQQPRATLRTEDAEMAPVAMSPDGRWLVGQSDSGAVRLWDLSVAEPSASSIVLLTGVRGLGPPVSVSFTPNSRRLLLKSGETTGVWTLDPQDLAAIARRAAGRQLTLEELHRYGVAPWTRCYYQAVEHHRKGQYEQAIDDYSRVIEMDADCRLAWANRGKARLDCEKYDEAIADLSKAIELRASYALAWRVRGSAKDALGKREEAAADFDRAAELQPIYDFDAYFRKRAYLVGEEELPAVFETRAPLRTTLLSANYLHHYYEGRREYDRRQCGKASCRFSRSISLNPNHAAAWFGRALARQWTGRWDDAIADLSKALDLKPDYIEARHERAVTLHKAGRREKAIEEYSLLLDANPEYYAAWANRELAMAGKSSRPFRLENKKTIAPDPKDYFTWFERGEANLSRKKWEEAAADYSKVLAIRPDHYLAWGNRGIAHALSGRREQAIEDYTRAIALEANCCLLWHNRGVSLHRLSRYAEAMDDFSKAVKLKPDHASSWRFRGDAKSALGRWKDAIDDYTQSIALKPDEEAVWTRRGEAHRCLRQWRAAEADFRKSLELNRDSVTGWYGLGLVLADKQEFANARSAFQRIGRIRSAAAVQRERAARMADYMSRLSEMAKRFPEILSGATQAANPNEGVLFAELAHFQGAFALSARLSLDAFRRDPRLVVDSGIVHRYNAACSAALAGGGEGDAANTPENVRARWRKQARAWLRDELALKTRRLESRRPQDLEETAAMLQRWQADPDLSAIRDPEPLSQLGADERQECEGLWRDVERLVQRALNTAKASSAATSKG